MIFSLKDHFYLSFPAIALLILPLSSCNRGAAGNTIDKSRATTARTKIKVVAVEQQQQQRKVEAVGSLFPYEEVTVSSEAEGRIEQVLVDVGDRVRKGQVLARITPIEFELTVEQQRAALAQARARLGLRDGDKVLEDVGQAAEVKRAAADLADAEQKYRRARSLMEAGVIPRQNYEETEARYKSAKATYDLAVQQIENLRASMNQTQVSLNLANKRLRDTQIRAPFDGHIKGRAVTVGQYLKVQTPVMTIVNIDPLRVRLSVPEKFSPWVRVDRNVRITLEAFPGREFAGRISRINPSVDEKTRTFEIEALVANRSGELKPGSFIKAIIESDKIDSILTIPQDTTAYLFGSYKVFVVQGKAIKEREVKLGDHFGDRVEVIEGLRADDKIAVREGGQQLKDGTEVEIVK